MFSLVLDIIGFLSDFSSLLVESFVDDYKLVSTQAVALSYL